jgi:hypothetical protein
MTAPDGDLTIGTRKAHVKRVFYVDPNSGTADASKFVDTERIDEMHVKYVTTDGAVQDAVIALDWRDDPNTLPGDGSNYINDMQVFDDFGSIVSNPSLFSSDPTMAGQATRKKVIISNDQSSFVMLAVRDKIVTHESAKVQVRAFNNDDDGQGLDTKRSTSVRRIYHMSPADGSDPPTDPTAFIDSVYQGADVNVDKSQFVDVEVVDKYTVKQNQGYGLDGQTVVTLNNQDYYNLPNVDVPDDSGSNVTPLRLDPFQRIVNVGALGFLVELHIESCDYGYDGIDAFALGGGSASSITVYAYPDDDSRRNPVVVDIIDSVSPSWGAMGGLGASFSAYNVEPTLPKQKGVTDLGRGSLSDVPGYTIFAPVGTAEPAPIPDYVNKTYSIGFVYGPLFPRPRTPALGTANLHRHLLYFSGGQQNFDATTKQSNSNLVGDIQVNLGGTIDSLDLTTQKQGPFTTSFTETNTTEGPLPANFDQQVHVGIFVGVEPPGPDRCTGDISSSTCSYTFSRSNGLRGGDCGVGFIAIVYPKSDFKFAGGKIVPKDSSSTKNFPTTSFSGFVDFNWKDGPKTGPTAQFADFEANTPEQQSDQNSIASYIDTNIGKVYGPIPKDTKGITFRLAKKIVDANGNEVPAGTKNSRTVGVLWPVTPKAFLNNGAFPQYSWSVGKKDGTFGGGGGGTWGKAP